MIFNERGLLQPAGIVSLTVDEFEEFFVKSFPNSSTRQAIFSDYTRYIEQFSDEICSTFSHWIDGSFVTNKLNPRDLDVVILIDDLIYSAKQKLIDDQFRRAGAKKDFPYLDVYTVRCYSKNSANHFITEYDLVYWYNWFEKTRPNRAGKQYSKGFIEVFINQ